MLAVLFLGNGPACSWPVFVAAPAEALAGVVVALAMRLDLESLRRPRLA